MGWIVWYIVIWIITTIVFMLAGLNPGGGAGSFFELTPDSLHLNSYGDPDDPTRPTETFMVYACRKLDELEGPCFGCTPLALWCNLTGALFAAKLATLGIDGGGFFQRAEATTGRLCTFGQASLLL